MPSSSTHSSYTTAAPRQLHATLPGPHGAHACLTIYDVCPHTTRSTNPSSRCKDHYLHCGLPSLPPGPVSRTVEYIDNRGREIIETTSTTLSSLPEPRCTRAIERINNKRRKIIETTRGTLSSIHHPKEKAMATSLAPLVLSKHSPVMHHIRKSTAEPPLRSTLKHAPSMPTIHLLTFSTDRTPTTRAFAALLNEHLPLHVPLRYTIDARNFLVPPAHICMNYSGVAGVVQDEVLRDDGARKEIERVVDELTRFVKHGGCETGIAICCTMGTHRSVAIAELIALGVRREVRRLGSREGAKVVVRHVHRIKGPKDPY